MIPRWASSQDVRFWPSAGFSLAGGTAMSYSMGKAASGAGGIKGAASGLGAVAHAGAGSVANAAKYKPTDAQIGCQLAEFIKKVRSVSIDPVVLRQNWMTAYHYAIDQAAIMLNDYARDNDPFQDVGHRSVSVQIASVVRSSEDSFDLRWRETAYRDGVKLAANTYTANLSIILKTPTDEETLHQNPLGIYVHGINWSKDLIRGE